MLKKSYPTDQIYYEEIRLNLFNFLPPLAFLALLGESG